MQRSPIEWTDFTSNPLQYRNAAGESVWACIHKSDGCRFCYSEALAKRYGRGKPFTAKEMKGLTPFLSEKELRHMLTYKPAKGGRCFVGDMTDLFGEWVPFELLDQLFAVFALRQDVTWQLLTKRPERMLDYMRNIENAANAKGRFYQVADSRNLIPFPAWPFPNVWLGVSVEDQKTADARIPLLLLTPAAVRFVSYEPALGPMDFERIDLGASCSLNALSGCASSYHAIGGQIKSRTPGWKHLDWIIVGGESGPGARPFNLQWARDVVQQCKAVHVPVFVKQLGADPYFEKEVGTAKGGCPELLTLNDRKGGDMEEWPSDLCCRQFPGDI